jgi:hypothetical protein
MLHRNIWITVGIALALRVSFAEAGFISMTLSPEPGQLSLQNLPEIPAGSTSSSSEPTPAENVPHVDLPTADVAENAGVGVPSSQVTNNSASSPGAAHSEWRLPETTPEISQELVIQANSSLPPPLAHRLFRPPRND